MRPVAAFARRCDPLRRPTFARHPADPSTVEASMDHVQISAARTWTAPPTHAAERETDGRYRFAWDAEATDLGRRDTATAPNDVEPTYPDHEAVRGRVPL
jgi:hypothetical protein